jgi:hypothetical protein
MRDFAPLLYLPLLVAFYFGTAHGMAWLLHWYAHKTQCAVGTFVTWRRLTDNVMMTGYRCHRCGKLTCIQPSSSSYKRMMRGERYY